MSEHFGLDPRGSSCRCEVDGSRELRRAGYDVDWKRVETEADYRANLDPAVDVILADGVVPGFDASHALKLLQDRDLNIPLIVVTGSLSEERAVELMRLGAADYLLKDRLARLGQAVSQTLEKRQLYYAKHQAEEDRKHFFVLALDLLCVAGFDGYFKDLNPAWETTLGWTVEELRSRPYHDFLHPGRSVGRVPPPAFKIPAHSKQTKTSFENRFFRCKSDAVLTGGYSGLPHPFPANNSFMRSLATSPNNNAWRNNTGKHKKWRLSAGWQGESPTTSTICLR